MVSSSGVIQDGCEEVLDDFTGSPIPTTLNDG